MIVAGAGGTADVNGRYDIEADRLIHGAPTYVKQDGTFRIRLEWKTFVEHVPNYEWAWVKWYITSNDGGEGQGHYYYIAINDFSNTPPTETDIERHVRTGVWRSTYNDGTYWGRSVGDLARHRVDITVSAPPSQVWRKATRLVQVLTVSRMPLLLVHASRTRAIRQRAASHRVVHRGHGNALVCCCALLCCGLTGVWRQYAALCAQDRRAG